MHRGEVGEDVAERCRAWEGWLGERVEFCILMGRPKPVEVVIRGGLCGVDGGNMVCPRGRREEVGGLLQ